MPLRTQSLAGPLRLKYTRSYRLLVRGLAHRSPHPIKVVSPISQRSLRLLSSATVSKPLASATSRASTPLFRLPNTAAPLQTPKRPFHQSSVNMVKELGSHESFKTALESEKLVVLDCYATWCGPCKLIAPKIIQFSKDYPDVDFYKLDVDEVTSVAAELGVRAMPTFYFFKGGEKVGEVVGANPKAISAAIIKYKASPEEVSFSGSEFL